MAQIRPARPTSGLAILPLLAIAVMITTMAPLAEAHGRPAGQNATPRRNRPLCRDRSETFLRRELHSCRGSRPRARLNERLVEELSGRAGRQAEATSLVGGAARWNGSGEGCPSWKGLVASTELEARALAPWAIRVDYDLNRYPSRIAMAECLCAGCVEPRAGTFHQGLVSVPVVYRMRVLYRKACDPLSGLYGYERRWVDVPLACTCAVPKTAREPPAS